MPADCLLSAAASVTLRSLLASKKLVTIMDTFKLYRIGFCSFPDVAPVPCEQELMLWCRNCFEAFPV